MDMAELQVQLREMVDATLAAVPVDGLELEGDYVREAQCYGPSEGAIGGYGYEGPLLEGDDPLAIVTAAAEHWDEVGIPHGEVQEDEFGLSVFAVIEVPETHSEFNFSVEVATQTKLIGVGGSTPCVPGAAPD